MSAATVQTPESEVQLWTQQHNPSPHMLLLNLDSLEVRYLGDHRCWGAKAKAPPLRPTANTIAQPTPK